MFEKTRRRISRKRRVTVFFMCLRSVAKDKDLRNISYHIYQKLQHLAIYIYIYVKINVYIYIYFGLVNLACCENAVTEGLGSVDQRKGLTGCAN